MEVIYRVLFLSGFSVPDRRRLVDVRMLIFQVSVRSGTIASMNEW